MNKNSEIVYFDASIHADVCIFSPENIAVHIYVYIVHFDCRFVRP
jgi:hypothetical protein